MEEVAGPLIQQGALGIFILILIAAIVALWRKLDKKELEMKAERDKHAQDLQAERDKRVDDLKTVLPLATKSAEVTETLNDVMAERSRTETATTAALQVFGGKIDSLERRLAA